jgi:hypothetical protein
MTTIPLAVLQNYRKDLAWKPGHGYGRNIGTDSRPIWVAERTGGVGSLIVHTTNGNAGSTLRGECEFIRDSPLVGIHDEIGHDGTLAEILPGHMVAWHSGATIPGFSNNQSYGIELHNAVSEQLTPVQIATLTWRVKSLIAEHGIPKNRIDTHRAVAVPPGRKTDPSDWTDASFYQWRDSLYTDTPVSVSGPPTSSSCCPLATSQATTWYRRSASLLAVIRTGSTVPTNLALSMRRSWRPHDRLSSSRHCPRCQHPGRDYHRDRCHGPRDLPAIRAWCGHQDNRQRVPSRRHVLLAPDWRQSSCGPENGRTGV